MLRAEVDDRRSKECAPSYDDWLDTIRREGGQLAWLWQNSAAELHNLGRTTQQMGESVLLSKKIRDTIQTMSAQRQVAESVVRAEVQQILSTMALDFRFHSAAQPIGYSLAKVFGRIFSHIWVNSARMCQIRQISSDRSVPIVWLPTHRSYLDFLLLSLLSYHYHIQLPAICAADDFRASRLLGEALRRCGAFFIRRSFKEDLLYRSVFAEYVQQILTNGDRPIEFFIEGQRSRTAKSVFPRNGLLQLVVEPFIKAQLYDTILIPVTIDYDRILEEQLFAWELIGFSKPRETTMGLLRAHSILSDNFGDIRVTVGQPISIRKYFFEKIGRRLDMRLENQQNPSAELDERVREMIRTLALDVVHLQNANGTLTLWPFVALVLLQTLNDFLSNSLPISPFSVTLRSLNSKSETFVRLFEKYCSQRIWRRTAEEIEEEIRHFVRLHRAHLTLSPSYDSVQLVDLSPPADALPPFLLNSIILANQANPFIYKMAPFCFGAIVRLSVDNLSVDNLPDDNLSVDNLPDDNFRFLRRLFDYEFVPFANEFSINFDEILTDTSDLWHLAQILKPFLIAYYSIFSVLLTDCSNSILTSAELTRHIHQQLLEMARQNAKIPLQIISMDIVKNALNSLNAFQIAKMDDQSRLRFDFVQLNKITKRLANFLFSLRWTPQKTAEKLNAKI